MKLFISLLFLSLLVVFPLWSQQDRGTFTGTVTDSTGSVVPNVRVAVVNTQTNATYDSRTNDVGQYRVPNLPIGSYKITFETDGFKSFVRDGLTLNIAQVARVDAQLQVGSTTDSIEVRAEVPLLQTETPEVGTSLDNRTVTDLPLGFSGGRYAETFAFKLTAGVAGDNWQSRINGSPAFTKQVVLDGADATIYIGGQFGESSPSMEALEEFKVQTSGMSAEFGRTGGGVFNFVMKSGSNQFHGSALGLIHNEWMDANTFANNTFNRPRNRDRRHDYGGSFGGPVWIPKIYNGKDKTFFYVAYERYKESFGGAGSPTVTSPLDEWWDGDLSRYLTDEKIGTDALGRDVFRGMIFDPATTRTVDGQIVRDPFPGNIIPADRISSVARNLGNLFKQHYSPTVRDASTGQIALINNSFFPASNQAGFTQDQLSMKFDHHLSSLHKLSGSYVWIDRPRNLLDQGGVWDFNDPDGGPLSRARIQHVQSYYGRAAYDWTVSATMLNHLQLGFNRQVNPSTSKHIGESGVDILGIQGMDRKYNFPEIDIRGGDRVNFPVLGYTANDFLAGTNYELIDTFSWQRGKHSLRFGLDYRRTYFNSKDNAGPGQFTFQNEVTGLPGSEMTGHPFASMLLGEASSASVVVDTPVGSVYQNWALFVQDDFKVNSRLTLNLGLRWDYQPQGVEKYDRLHNFNPNLIDPVLGIPGAVEFAGDGPGRNGRRTFYPNSKTGFAPRLGLAYQFTDRFAMRAGYGLFYHARNPNGWSGVPWGNKAGFKVTSAINRPSNQFLPAFNWDNGYNASLQGSELDPDLATYFADGVVAWDPDGGQVGNTQQWNFNLQYELPWQMVFDIGYVGSKSSRIQANELKQLNQMPTSALQFGDQLSTEITSQADIPAAAAALGARYPFNDGRTITLKQAFQPFPQVPDWSNIRSWNVPLGFSTYNAMQVQLNKRYSGGAQWLFNYTWSKSIDNMDSAFGDTGGWMNGSRPTDYYNLKLEKSISTVDRTHWFKIGASYELPFGRGRRFGADMNRFLDFAVGGWTVQYIGNYSSGEPLGLQATDTPNFNIGNNRAVLLNTNGQPLKLGSFDSKNFDLATASTAGVASNQYIDGSLVRNVQGYERGNASFRISQLRTPWFLSDDFSLQKNFQLTESSRIQFRAEGLNMLNRHRINSIETNASNPLFGQVTGVSDDRRQLQFGIRLDF